MVFLLSIFCQTSGPDQAAFCGMVIFLLELFRHVTADFKAVHADGGGDGGDKICGICAINLMHHSDSLCSDSFDGAFPAGMHGSDCLMNRIGQKDHDTICTDIHQCLSGDIGHHSIHILKLIRPYNTIAAVNLLQNPDIVRMGLVGQNH